MPNKWKTLRVLVEMRVKVDRISDSESDFARDVQRLLAETYPNYNRRPFFRSNITAKSYSRWANSHRGGQHD